MNQPSDDQSLLGGPLDLPEAAPPRPNRKPPKSKVKRALIIIGVAIVVVAMGFGVYLLVTSWNSNDEEGNTPQTNASNNSPTEQASDLTDEKAYQSDELRLQFSYPASWIVTEKDGGIQVTSPEITYQTASGDTVQGDFRLYIRQGAREVDGQYIGEGIALQPSEKLVYTDPGPSQREDTNLSLFGALSTDYFTFFMVTSNYDLEKDDQLGSNYGSEPTTYIIAGGFAEQNQTDALDFNNIDLEQAQDTEVYQQAREIIASIKLR